MDPEIKRQLALQTEEKIEQVKKEMAWEEEKHRIALHKLKVRYGANEVWWLGIVNASFRRLE